MEEAAKYRDFGLMQHHMPSAHGNFELPGVEWKPQKEPKRAMRVLSSQGNDRGPESLSFIG